MNDEEPTVQVPVSLPTREQIAEVLYRVKYSASSLTLAEESIMERSRIFAEADAVLALFSQPNPTAEPIGVEYGVVLDDLGSTDTYATEAEARAAATSDTPVVRIVTTPLDPESYAESPRIEDMAPGTRLRADRLVNRDEWEWDGHNLRRLRDGLLQGPEDIDPSTIRDLTPPKDAS